MKKCNVKKSAEVKKPAKKACKCCAKKAPAKKAAKKEVKFTIHAEKGKNVFLAGCFNEWDPTAKKLAYKAKQGLYETAIKLEPGRYEYKFVIDGIWCADPENAESVQNDQGTFNSVITVK